MRQPSEMATIKFYDDHADMYVADTLDVDMESLYSPFVDLLADGGAILDAGCGSGRDTKAFLESGFQLTAIDASAKMVEMTTRLTGQPAQQIRFQELENREEFDGIWACASLLHVPLVEIDEVLRRFACALRVGGICYLSFKEGNGERIDKGRHFTDFTKSSLRQRLDQQALFMIVRLWGTRDLRPGRMEEKWVNVLLRKV